MFEFSFSLVRRQFSRLKNSGSHHHKRCLVNSRVHHYHITVGIKVLVGPWIKRAFLEIASPPTMTSPHLFAVLLAVVGPILVAGSANDIPCMGDFTKANDGYCYMVKVCSLLKLIATNASLAFGSLQ